MTEPNQRKILDDMITYYGARAAEYDEWWERKGRYDRGPEANAAWFAEAEEVYAGLDAHPLPGEVLELAPGTGIWTERLARIAAHVTAVDASTEMIEINRRRLDGRVPGGRVTYFQADLFEWRPERTYDGAFFGFWLSHIPLERLDAFLAVVATAVRPGGRLFFVDGRREQVVTAADQALPDEGSEVMTRRLNDGRTFEIVKTFYEPASLAAHFAAHGFDVDVRETRTFFIYGFGTRRG